MGNNLLRILCLEDNPQHAETIKQILFDAGYNLCVDLASTKAEFEFLLRNNHYELILSDFKLPEFDAFGALEICKQVRPDIPFICVSESVGEENATEILKNGVVDYVLKDRLDRLPFAIKRALEQVKEKEILQLAEDALRESEERLRLTLEVTKIGIWDLDFKNNLIYISPTAYTMLGYKKDKFAEDSNTWTERIHPDDRPFVEDIHNKIFNKEITSYDYIIRMKHADGSYRWIWDKGKVILNKKASDKSIERLLGIWVDVTDRKQLEEEVIRSQEKFKELFENAPVGYHEIDGKGNIVAVNLTELRLLGYSYEEMIGAPVWKFAKDREESKMRVLGKLSGTLSPNRNFEQIFKRKNGSLFPALVDDVVFKNNLGEITGIRSTILDITEYKLVEEKATQLAEIVQSTDDAIIRKTPGGIIISWNKGAENIFGYTEDEVIGKSISLLVTDDNQKKINELFSLIRSGKHIDHFEITGRNKNGSFINLSVTISPIRNAVGKTIAFSTIARDITKKKIADDRQTVITKILSILNRPNEWQKIINDILNELKIFTRFEAIAIRLKDGDDYPYFVANGFSENFVQLEKSLCPSISDSKNHNGKLNLECMCGRIICRDINNSLSNFTKGGSFWINNLSKLLASNPEKVPQIFTRNACIREGFESVALIPLISGVNIIGLLQFNDKRPGMFTRDMIEFFEKVGSTIGIAFKRMEVEKQIRESEERYRFIVDATNDAIYRFNFTTKKYDYMSPTIEKLTGYTPEEINDIGFKSIVVKISKYNAENMIVDITGASNEQDKTREWHADYEIKTKDGESVWLSDHSYPWQDKSRNSIGSFGILSDITERKRAEEEIIHAKEKAEEMNRLKSSFLANMSHELRTPLIGILGFADFLQEELEDEIHKDFAKLIFDSGSRLKETLNLILDLSKIEANALDTNIEQIELTKYIPDLVRIFQKSIEQKNIKLEIRCSQELLYCKLDKSLLNSIINNLMNNAVKYTQKGIIMVQIVKINDSKTPTAEITITDTGIGISTENLKIIFDPFRQVSEGLSRKFEGTGLGLTLVKKYVEQMDGTVSVESEIGVGTKFKIVFPLIKSASVIKEHPSERYIANNRFVERKMKEKPTVLYVEDDQISQKVVDSMVGNLYSIDYALDGETAIELVKKKKYEAILMDINLTGGINGLETTHEIKKLKGYEHIPIIAVTAYAMIGDKEKILSEGCTHYISKPFTNYEMQSLLKECLNEYAV